MNNMGQIEGRASGTTFQEISKKNFRPMPALVPPEPVLSAFEARVSPLFGRMRTNLEQSRVLMALRDELLPLLISGVIRVEAG